MVSAYSGWAGGDQERPSPDRSHTKRSPIPALPVRLTRTAPLGRKTSLSEVTEVLCLTAVTISGLVLPWLEARRIDAPPGVTWVKQLLRGMRSSRQVHSPEQQHANTHRLFIKLCWLMDKHAVSADRVVNIDETSCLCIRSGGAAAA